MGDNLSVGLAKTPTCENTMPNIKQKQRRDAHNIGKHTKKKSGHTEIHTRRKQKLGRPRAPKKPAVL